MIIFKDDSTEAYDLSVVHGLSIAFEGDPEIPTPTDNGDMVWPTWEDERREAKRTVAEVISDMSQWIVRENLQAPSVSATRKLLDGVRKSGIRQQASFSTLVPRERRLRLMYVLRYQIELCRECARLLPEHPNLVIALSWGKIVCEAAFNSIARGLRHLGNLVDQNPDPFQGAYKTAWVRGLGTKRGNALVAASAAGKNFAITEKEAFNCGRALMLMQFKAGIDLHALSHSVCESSEGWGGLSDVAVLYGVDLEGDAIRAAIEAESSDLPAEMAVLWMRNSPECATLLAAWGSSHVRMTSSLSTALTREYDNPREALEQELPSVLLPRVRDVFHERLDPSDPWDPPTYSRLPGQAATVIQKEIGGPTSKIDDPWVTDLITRGFAQASSNKRFRRTVNREVVESDLADGRYRISDRVAAGDPAAILIATEERSAHQRAASTASEKLRPNLPQQQRDVFDLYYQADPYLNERQIADKLKMKISTVRTHLHRIKQKLASLAAEADLEK